MRSIAVDAIAVDAMTVDAIAAAAIAVAACGDGGVPANVGAPRRGLGFQYTWDRWLLCRWLGRSWLGRSWLLCFQR
jgi:hypothetical protein